MKAPLNVNCIEQNTVIAHALTIEGWMFPKELKALYEFALEMDSIVEIGSWKGRSTYVMAKAVKGSITAVDTFKGTVDEPELLQKVAEAGGSVVSEFMENMRDCPKLRVLVDDSVQAARGHADVDMVFVDGGHSYEQVVADLTAWAPKARKLICGDDIEHPAVARAVRDVLGEVETTGDTIWFKRLDVARANSAETPLFSILHTSARPEKWRAVYDDWMAKCVHPERVEYVLCVDPRWAFDLDSSKYDTPLDNVRVVVNNRRRCYVDGVAIAAEESTGSILIVNADDQFACENWDERLIDAVVGPVEGDAGLSGAALALDVAWVRLNGLERSIEEPFVVEVSTGTPDEHNRGVLVMPILTRARYEQQGFVFYPEYESMFADNDFCAAARQDGVIIDARHLMFPHRHQMFDGKGGWKTGNWKETLDKAYREQNRKEACAIGEMVFRRRTISGFQPIPKGMTVKRRSIALCLSGERFEGVWVDFLLALYAHLVDLNFDILKIRVATPNVYITRDTLRQQLMKFEPRPELCLWLDDDNPLSIAHFDALLAGIDSHPEVDGVAGWCWIHNEHKDGFMPSCGEWAPDHLHWNPFPVSLVHERGLRPFDTGGLPCMLMRLSAFDKAGESCFFPVISRELEHGMTGEDMAFFLAAEKGGAKFLVDPQVRVPHLKYVACEPVFPEEGRHPVKVACMMRVKNEARWIKHTIDSVRELCGDLIYVMEDGSTDDTRAICEAAGCVVLPSPFEGQGLDEARDKDWLMQEVISRCKPDWILMPDGDEELEAGGCAKIRRVLETNPPCDCFALRFLYFWNRIDTVRLDGVYGKLQRQSLFRANSEFRFVSYYSEGQTPNQNHVHLGLHTSNAPGLGGKVLPLNVSLLHYGYLHREDRIRKFAWITKLDPHNEGEGFYLHCVQGDIPEVPANALLKHGGPLKVETLPSRLVPKFDEVPGPAVVLDAINPETVARSYAWRQTAKDRCPVCDWPMATMAAEGCVPGNCSYRPDSPLERQRILERRAECTAAD